MTDGSDEYDRREQVVETERGFEIKISHRRGTDTRDDDTVTATWKMEQKPPRAVLTDLTSDVRSTMAALRGENVADSED